ncbi:MAG: hypothetical protein U9O85_07830 [Euryarchaeota archaeon]|nr:hypothetical protein [Euryarchaeota archaeon]
MTIRKPKTFWTCLVLFVVGVVIAVNIIQYNYPDFTPLAIFALLTGIGFIVAGYGLWIMKKWGAVLAIILSCLKLIQMLLYTTLSVYMPGGIIIYGGIILLAIQEWKKLLNN